MINGHERSLTKIKFNTEGDLLFSVSKDKVPSVWYADNGERLGTFNGHNGTVWCCDVRYDSTYFISGSADNTMRLWDVSNGKELLNIEYTSAVRTCGFSYDGSKLFTTTDQTMGNLCKLRVYDVQRLLSEGGGIEPTHEITVPKRDSKITSALWGQYDETIITGHDNGMLAKYDLKTQERVLQTYEHRGKINDIQLSDDQTMMIAASNDTTARLFDVDSYSALKLYKTDRPVNAASISPLKEHIVLGGGQDAMSVTTTSGKAGKFEARFFHMVLEEELGRVKGHFGPINTLAFRPDGRGYASGGEDGYIRLHQFDPSYFSFEFEM